MRPRALDRVEAPAHDAGRSVEPVDLPPPARRVAGRADEDEALPRNGSDVDELLLCVREMPAPELAAVRRCERERVGIRRTVDPAALDGDPVRPLIRSVVMVRPANLPCLSIERENV